MELIELAGVLKSASGYDSFDFCEVLEKIAGEGRCHDFAWCDNCKKFIMDSIASELEKSKARLLPEGMEWPRFEDGEPVEFGDEGLDIRGNARSVNGIKFTQSGFVFISDGMGRVWWANDHGPTEDPCVDPNKRVKRPAPKVLDADGVEIRVGDEVFVIATGKVHHVAAIDPVGKRFRSIEQMSGDSAWLDPAYFTHRAPVLAADGRPLREGETVYLTDSPTAFVVDDIMTREDGATVVHLKDGAWNLPQYLTHERPDSWKRLMEDAGKSSVEYWGCSGVGCSKCPAMVDGKKPFERLKCSHNCISAKDVGIVRRAKELAERGM